jgi:hypothetical protein
MRKVEDRDRRKFQSRDCRLQDVRLLAERKILNSWMMPGKPRSQCRDNRRLGWCRKVDAREPLAPRTAADHCRSAKLVFGWSFYRQGTSGQSSSADEFFDAALAWFGDPDPRIGTGWEKGERLAHVRSASSDTALLKAAVDASIFGF